MEFRTIVSLPPDAPTITPQSRAIVLGSCFAEHVGARLLTALGEEQGCVNPFGVLYNPMSIAQALDVLLCPTSTTDARIFEGRDGLWHSWLHSTKYSAPTREECHTRCEAAIAEARRLLNNSDLLIITFGTSRCYCLQDGSVVANCHKEVPATFTERDCTVEEIVTLWQPLLDRLHTLRPHLQVVFTVSPYRYRKYGFHASRLAKARLLMAIDQMEGCHYFPSYEIVLDELRDYRFYNADMLHPSEQAIDYVWERFSEWTFSPEMFPLYQQRLKEQKHNNHYVNH